MRRSSDHANTTPHLHFGIRSGSFSWDPESDGYWRYKGYGSSDILRSWFSPSQFISEKNHPVEQPTPGKPRASTGLIAFMSAFASSHNWENREIFTIRPDGSGQNSLTHQFTDAFAPIWSPDGKKILFHGGYSGDIYVIGSDGSDLRKILDLAEVALEFPRMKSFNLIVDVSWLPDGKTIAICAGSWPDTSKVYLIDVASLKRTALPLAKAAWSLAWSPDGTRIAFRTFSSTAVDRHHPFQIWVADANGARQVPVCDPCDVQDGPVWLPDSKRLIFVKHGPWSREKWNNGAGGDGEYNNKLCMKNVDSGEFTEADFSWDVAGIVVSPDGQRIAFSPLHPSHSFRIYIFHLIGSIWQQELTIENGELPTWSPDGASLAFASHTDGEQPQIWIVNADGTGRRKLTPPPNGDPRLDEFSHPTLPVLNSDPTWSSMLEEPPSSSVLPSLTTRVPNVEAPRPEPPRR